MTELITTAPAEVEAEKSELTLWAQNLVIRSSDDYGIAGNRLKQIKGVAKKLTDWFAPMKERAWAAHKGVLAKEKEMLDPLAEAESLAKSAMLKYQQAEQRKADEDRRRLQAIADEAARKERERAEAEASRQRAIEAEARAKADAARRAAEEASAAERKKLLAEAAAAERKAAAAAVKVETQSERAEMSVAPVVHVAAESPKVSGVNTVKAWKFRIVDAAAIPREYLAVDEKKLGQFARMMKEGAVVPGVEFYSEDTLSSRGA